MEEQLVVHDRCDAALESLTQLTVQDNTVGASEHLSRMHSAQQRRQTLAARSFNHFLEGIVLCRGTSCRWNY